MKLHLSLHGHANRASLPLRHGIRIMSRHQQNVELESFSFDEVGTQNQRQSEINRGNKHYVGKLSIPNEVGSGVSQFDCRVVVGSPSTSEQLPPIITILRQDFNKGDMTVTSHIEGMLKSGKINSEDLINIFHPAYLSGKLLSSNDCESIFDEKIRSKTPVVSLGDPTVTALLKDPDVVVSIIKSNSIDEVDLKDPLSYKPLPIEGVKYQYVLADAYIENVRIENDCIAFSCINSKGEVQEMHSFKLSPRPHLNSLHTYAFNYLKDREQQRALFAICDTDPCRGFIAESVTAISLQLMRI